MIFPCFKVNEWAEGKRGNIRALLCSLHLILWEEEARWKPCGMHNLVQPDQVTKSYADTCILQYSNRVAPVKGGAWGGGEV